MRSRLSLLVSSFAALVLLVGTVGSVAAGEPDAACTGHWPAVVTGKPSLWAPGAVAGDYIWRDATGFHVRVTHRGTSKVVFAGRIVSDQPLRVQAIRIEGSDYVALSADKKTISYRLTNYGRVDGLNFQTACAQKLTFVGNMNGERLPRWRIFIGARNVHPLQNPFTIYRVS